MRVSAKERARLATLERWFAGASRRQSEDGAGNLPEVQSSNTAPNSQIGNGHLPTVDWLTVHQDHVRAPRLGSNLLLFIDLETQEVKSQAVRAYQHEGSFSSKLMVRCDGRRVEVSGNPSRWGVPHSLDGFTSVDAAVTLYNSILAALGLPGFSSVERSFVAPRLLQRGDTLIPEGCQITRIDLAQLFETSGPDEAATVIRSLGQVTHRGKVPMVYGNGETVAWGSGSRHVYIKYYAKGPEMKAHGEPEAQQAASWANAVGLIRHEVTLRSMWLRKSGLEVPAKWTGEVMRAVMKGYSMHERVQSSRTSWADVYEKLLALGVPRGRAQRAQEAAYAYLSGHVFRRGGNITNGSFYRLRADLRRVGVDISAPLNVSALPTAVRVVEMRPAWLPQGFRRTG